MINPSRISCCRGWQKRQYSISIMDSLSKFTRGMMLDVGFLEFGNEYQWVIYMSTGDVFETAWFERVLATNTWFEIDMRGQNWKLFPLMTYLSEFPPPTEESMQ